MRFLILTLLVYSLTSCCASPNERRPPHWQYQGCFKPCFPCSPFAICKDDCESEPRRGRLARKRGECGEEDCSRSKRSETKRKSRKNHRSNSKDHKKFHSDAEHFNEQYHALEGIDATSLIQEYCVNLRYNKNLRLEDSYAYKTGGEYFIRMDFSSQDIMEMAESRMLIVDVVEGFIERINKEPGLVAQNYGQNFTPDNLEIYIDFQCFYNRYVDSAYIGFLSLRAGLTHYWAGDAFEPDPSCWHQNSETYVQSYNITNGIRRGEKIYAEQHPVPESAFDREFFYLKQEDYTE